MKSKFAAAALLINGLLLVFAPRAAAMGESSVTRSQSASAHSGDMLALSLLGTLLLTLAIVTFCGRCILRHQRKPSPEREFLEDLCRTEAGKSRRMSPNGVNSISPEPIHPTAAPAGEPWEKHADWWRKDFSPD